MITRISRNPSQQPTSAAPTAPILPAKAPDAPTAPPPRDMDAYPTSQQDTISTELAKEPVSPVVPGADISATLERQQEPDISNPQAVRMGTFTAVFDEARRTLSVSDDPTNPARKGAPRARTAVFNMQAPDGTRVMVAVIQIATPESVIETAAAPTAADTEMASAAADAAAEKVGSDE